jgi:hypothetical protein
MPGPSSQRHFIERWRRCLSVRSNPYEFWRSWRLGGSGVSHWGYVTPLVDAEDSRDNVTLDASSGWGGFALEAARCGAEAVFAVDLSEAVEAAETLTG